MTLTATQKAAIEDIIHILCTTTATRGKRQIAGMFLELVDRTDWPQYFEVIPEPRCLNNIRSSLEKN
jgi:chromatin structure-remodeling complex subunit RSC1/2